MRGNCLSDWSGVALEIGFGLLELDSSMNISAVAKRVVVNRIHRWLPEWGSEGAGLILAKGRDCVRSTGMGE